MTIWIILGVVVLALVLMYNKLVSARNQVDNMWGAVDTQLKKRYDLIPNLVETLKQYASHEKETLGAVTELREKAMNAKSGDQTVQVENELTRALSGLMVKVEAYPDLKANENFIHLQKTLANTEEEISAARRSYNQAVTDYNNSIEMFPLNMVNGMTLKLARKDVFEIPEAERQNIDVKELFGN